MHASTPGIRRSLGLRWLALPCLLAWASAATAANSARPLDARNPAELSVAEGGTAILVVVSAAPSPQFRWQKDGVELAATGPVFQIVSVSPSDAGTYTALVSSSKGRSASPVAVLSVAAPAKERDAPKN